MAINNIEFNRLGNGLGRPLPGTDHISGFLYYSSSATQSSYQTIYQKSELTVNTEDEVVQAVSDYFDNQPKGVLHIGIAETDTTYDYSEIEELQAYAKGAIKQMLIINYDDIVNGSSVSLINAQAVLLQDDRPLHIIFDGDFGSYGTLGDIPDMLVSGQKYVSVVVSKSKGSVISGAAALLGVISAAKVSENPGWVGKFNIELGDNFSEIEMVTGEDFESVNDTQLSAINDLGLISIRKLTDINGSFFMDGFTLDLRDSDYFSIESTRTMNKSIRGVRIKNLPSLNSPLVINADGSLSEGLISHFQGNTEDVLQDMLNNGEISAYKVTINPLQNVLATSKLVIDYSIVPIGVARHIQVNVGFSLKV